MRPSRSRFLDLTCTDALGDPLTYVIDTPPAKGTLSRQRRVPHLHRGRGTGADSFILHAHSPTIGDSAPQTQASRSARPPTATRPARRRSTTAKPGQARTITPTCSDADADPLTFTKQSEPAHGTLRSNDGVLRYTADAGYTGPDSFTYRASDAFGGQSAVSTARSPSRTRTRRRSAPPARSATRSQAGQQLVFPPAPCSDPEGDALTYEIPARPRTAR